MAEQTAIALQDGKKALVAGLTWQPLSQSAYGKKVAEIRELAERIDATRHIPLKAPAGDYIGLYNYDAELSDEERTGKVFSLATAFAEKVDAAGAILAYRIADGARKGHLALVVLEDGAPSLDLVAAESEAVSTIDTYLSGTAGEQAFKLYSNAPDLFENAQLIPSDFFSNGYSNKHALQGLPNDLIKLGALLGGVILAVGGLFVASEYLEEQEQLRMAEEVRARAQIPEYLQALEAARTSIGMRGDDVLGLLNQLAEQPAIARGWVLESIICNNGNCNSQWQSRGGYTRELIEFLPDHKPTVNYGNPQALGFSFSFPVRASGISNLADLPLKPAVTELLFQERQAWNKSGIKTNAAAGGVIWPLGYPNVPTERAVHQFPVEVTGSLPLVSDFLQRYPNNIFWNNVTLRINAENPTDGVSVELKGAFYGY